MLMSTVVAAWSHCGVDGHNILCVCPRAGPSGWSHRRDGGTHLNVKRGLSDGVPSLLERPSFTWPLPQLRSNICSL